MRGQSAYAYRIYKAFSAGKEGKLKFYGNRHIYWDDKGNTFIKLKTSKYVPANKLRDKKGIFYVI